MTSAEYRALNAPKTSGNTPRIAPTHSPKGKTQPAPRERNTDELEAQSEKRKDYNQRRAEAELSKLNAQEVPRYQVGKGESTLGTVRFFHLQPAQQEQLLTYATTVLNAKPA